MKKNALYDPQYEHDACGIGFVCNLDGTASRDVVDMGMTVLRNMAHRGAAGADADTGDGAGVLLRLPDALLRDCLDADLPPEGAYGLGVVFFAPEHADRAAGTVESIVAEAGWKLAAWRRVPVRPERLGEAARACMPDIRQFVVLPPSGGPSPGSDSLERGLYILRKSIDQGAAKAGLGPESVYIVSLSSRTVIYKGMMMAAQAPQFYPDLQDARLASPFAIVHQRYSTNTFPSWRLAQPFRVLAHNGEINTIRGNRNWLAAREQNLASPLYGRDIKKLFPLIESGVSDSASLDNALEFLMHGGRSMEHAMAMLIPQAWGEKYPMGPDLRGFFEYHAGLMEPWDGPAAVVFTDGRRIGACVDRNGLRPARYSVATDGLMVFASESGVLELPGDKTAEKGALRPGQMLLAELGQGLLVKNAEIKSRLARMRPYRRWVQENRMDIPGFFSANTDFAGSVSNLPYMQKLFGYSRDDTEVLFPPMAVKGSEAVGSMGADIPLPVLDERPQSLFAYFRQQFAQITNPPIDSIREALVMSLMTFIGYKPNILAEEPEQARLIKLRSPVISNDDLHRLEELRRDDFHSETLQSLFDLPAKGEKAGQSLARALARLEDEAAEAVGKGAKILVISDKKAGGNRLPIPAPLAVAAISRKLAQTGGVVSTGLICESGEARETSHIALLLSLGAAAVNPWLAFESIADLAARGKLPKPVSPTRAIENYVSALCKGLLKIMSKAGISTLRAYRGAQIFEAVGLGAELMRRYFPAVSSSVGGIGLERLERDVVRQWEAAAAPAAAKPTAGAAGEAGKSADSLPVGGAYRFRRNGARRLWSPECISLLQQAARNNDPEKYRRYAALINEQAEKAFTLRGLMDFAPGRPAPLKEVEPAESIMKRFVSGAMSFGSLSKEAHETLALAMNSIGARSNCGEGGEDPARYKPLPGEGSKRSAVKQVASGRFGVTLEYLVNADELQIKIAQGAKPGEGGQLPGHKVNEEIARVRHATPGVTLISPPPHHDIYSIEDIAQLIYDLRQANDAATISVKLAAESGIGAIAAGAAKADADIIVISGFDGGTGASPLSSIMHAGAPWEIGLAETQQTLALNRLRGRVRLQADGQMKTGRDAVVACLLGADEFGFAAAPLVSMGCVMMRKCHTNGCPVGIATQDPALRARFAGKPEHVTNYFRFVAEEMREIMASLGFRTVEEMTGRVDMLRPRPASRLLWESGLDFTALLAEPQGGVRRCMGSLTQPAALSASLDDKLLPETEKAVADGKRLERKLRVSNTDRSVGAKISSRIARARGHEGLPDDSIVLHFEGTAGQSFGAFAAKGLSLHLVGEANDYVGKGLSGGLVSIRPPFDIPPHFKPNRNMIAGNVALYGATSGALYLCGQAGERFAVRNGGALAVVEGVGDHGCEYMTGGRVVVLGLTGVNFAAGMSGGLAYVYDEDGFFDSRCNLEMADLDLLGPSDEAELKDLIERHVRHTGSPLGKSLLENWKREKGKFVKVFPMEYRRALGQMSAADAAAPRAEMDRA